MTMVTCALLILAIRMDVGSPISNQIPALGAIAWERDLSTCRKRALQENKPILILFTTFRGNLKAEEYGSTVLRHPLLQEAIEAHFIPLAIDNTGTGTDSATLDFFGEPRGNLPVLRVYDPSSQLESERLSGNFSDEALAMVLVVGLAKKGMDVPVFLKIIAGETSNTPDFFFEDDNMSSLKFVPMTARQLELVKSARKTGRDPRVYLSPNQVFILEHMKPETISKNKESLERSTRKKSLPELVASLKQRSVKPFSNSKLR